MVDCGYQNASVLHCTVALNEDGGTPKPTTLSNKRNSKRRRAEANDDVDVTPTQEPLA
jgi:hypothetical protein